jgi:hypothetical protein
VQPKTVLLPRCNPGGIKAHSLRRHWQAAVSPASHGHVLLLDVALSGQGSDCAGKWWRRSILVLER